MTTLSDAVATNDRRETLIALRNSIAKTIDDCESGRDIAALSKRLMEVIAEIDALPDPAAEANPLQAEQERARRLDRDG
ncbi:hypothetical protein FIC87_12605 [Eggerthella lenta]|uniref:Uncharacterized protein n=1 Tax=Eggerthella lenta TaxID=84112 RepID=A0A5C5BRU9_EGGLN|nr:hypothetical protein [Eggerthella lenta]TNU89034.1 hypothetical protein FIC87_12605 [Eggerthella lenta]